MSSGLNPDLLYLLIIVIPSALFIIIFGLGLIFGIARGFRKSIILGIQAIVAFAIVLTLFLVFIFTDPDGKRLVSVSNMFLGEGGLQAKLSQIDGVTVDASKTTLKEILMEVIPRLMFKDDSKAAYQELIVNNGAYVMTLITFVIRFAYAFIAAILYLLLVLIFYIIYLICYPERRHKRKIERKYESLQIDKPYKKHRLLGMLIGGIRGFVSSMLILSFIGSLFFILVGSNGNKKFEKKEFTNKDAETFYNYYSAVASYGNDGIYKVLGSIKNKDNIPYYLYLTELFYSGSLKDEQRNIDNNNIWMVEEIGTYTGFINSTVDLLMKYGFDEFDVVLDDSISGVTNKEHIEDLANVLETTDFQKDFDKLIDDFESKVYFHNFALSLIDSIANNVDELTKNMKDEMSKELLKILFKKGYVCTEIGETEGTEYPYLVASDILTKQDAKNLVKALMPIVISNVGIFLESDKSISTKSLLLILKEAIPEFKKLSILSDPERKDNINGVFERIYLYADKVMADKLSNNTQTGTQTRLLAEASKSSGVDWVNELQTLLDVGLNFITIGENIIPDNPDSDFKFLRAVLYMFNVDMYESAEDNTKASRENLEAFKAAKAKMADSKLVALALTTSYIQDLIVDSLKGFAPDLYIPLDLEYNEKVVDGKTVHGELYNLFDALEYALTNKETVDNLVDLMTDIDTESTEMFDILGSLAKKDKDDKSVLGELLESVYMRSILTSALVALNDNGSFGNVSLYLPDKVFESDKDGNTVKLIKNSELDVLIDNLYDVSLLLKDYLNEEGEHYQDPTLFIDSDVIVDLLDSVILEGTVSNVLKNELSKIDIFIIPDSLDETEGWLSSGDQDGEVKILVKSVKESGFDIKGILNAKQEELTEKAIDALNSLTQEKFEKLLTSRVIYYTASNAITSLKIDGFEIVIPKASKEETVDTYNGEAFVALKKSEISGLAKQAKHFVKSVTTSDLMAAVVKQKSDILSNNILLASLVSFIANNKDLENVLTIPSDLKALATKEALDEINQTSVWKTELSSLVDAIDELVDLSKDIKFDETLSDSILEELTKLNDLSIKHEGMSRLQVCYQSVIIKGTFTEKIDDAFINTVSNENVLLSIKEYAQNHDNDDDYLFVKSSELSSLIDTLKILDFKLGSDISADTLTEAISTLNDKYNDDETKLDRIYTSSIVRDIFNTQLDSSFTSDLISESVRNSDAVKETLNGNRVYKKSEVSGLIDTLKVFELDDLSSFDVESVKEKIPTLNEVYSGTETKLDKVYSSVIVRVLFSKQIDEALTSELVSDTVKNSDAVKDDVSGNKVYKKSEIAGLINTLNVFEITNLSSFNVSSIKTKIVTLNTKVTGSEETKLDKIYSSVIVKVIFTKQLDEVLTADLIYPLYRDTTYIKETAGDNPVYKKNEIAGLIDTLNEFEITNLSGFDVSLVKAKVLGLNGASIKDPENKSMLQVLYGEDTLPNYTVRQIIFKNLEEAIADLLSKDGLLLDSEDVVFGDADVTLGLQPVAYFVQSEVKNMISALNALGISNLDTVSQTDYAKLIKDINLNKVYVSYVIKDILTNKISESLASNTFVVDHPLAKETIYDDGTNTVDTYKKSELEAIQSFLTHLNVDEVNALSVDKIKLNNDTITDIKASYLLMGTITNNITVTNDTFTIPASTYDDENDLIKANDLEALLKAIATFGEGSLNNFKADDLTPNSLTNVATIVESTIMRANITKNIKNDNKPIYVADNALYAVKDTDIASTPNSITILTKSEITNIIEAFKVITGGASFEAKTLNFTTLSGYTVAQQDKLLSSNVMVNIITEVVTGTPSIDYAKFRTRFVSIDVVDDKDTVETEDDEVLFTYTFKPSTPAVPLTCTNALKDLTNVNSLTLEGEKADNHPTATKEDIMAFLYVIKTGAAGTDYSYAA